MENCKPFDVLNLGRYERQYWQGVTFGKKDKPVTERALYEYLAFILKLHGSQPVTGLSHLHGKKGKAMIHVGAVDAPVTIGEIEFAVEECVTLKQKELHVLGWEWEMGLQNLVVQEARNRSVKLLLLQIPREVMEQQAADKGDVRFFELAYLEAAIRKPKKLAAQVTLKDFVIPNAEFIPDEVRSKVRKWSDYIDYWAVDWDFRNDTFMQGWVTYRTRKDRTLALASDPHTYEKPGRYRVLVKVIDIFGNDTSHAYANQRHRTLPPRYHGRNGATSRPILQYGRPELGIGTNSRSRSETPRMPCRPFVCAKWREARRPREPGKADPPRRTTGPAAPARLRMMGDGLTAEERPQRTTGSGAPARARPRTVILLPSPPRRPAPP